MNSRANRVLLESTVEVFEEALFVCLEPSAAPGGFAEPPWRATIRAHGPAAAVLHLWVGGELAVELAESLMGVEEALDEESVGDALGEILNMICGRFYGGWDPAALVTLERPSVDRPSRAEGELLWLSNGFSMVAAGVELIAA